MSDLCQVPKEKWVEWVGSGKSGMSEYEGLGRQDGGASVSLVTVEQASVRCVTEHLGQQQGVETMEAKAQGWTDQFIEVEKEFKSEPGSWPLRPRKLVCFSHRADGMLAGVALLFRVLPLLSSHSVWQCKQIWLTSSWPPAATQPALPIPHHAQSTRL